MIVKLKDSQETILDIDKISFIQKGQNYSSFFDGTFKYTIAGFYLNIVLLGRISSIFYNSSDESREATIKAANLFIEDFKTIENHLLNRN
jgi:hypothetical protein